MKKLLAWAAAFSFAAVLLWASGIAPAAYNIIQNAGVALTARSTLNFVNGGCVDNAGQARTDCTVGVTQFSQTNSVTDAVQTTETSLAGTGSGSLVLPANFYKAGTVLKFEASGFYSTTATPGTITIRMKHTGGTTGTVVVGTTGAVTPLASITNGAWRLWGNITCRTTGTGGTFIINTIWEGDTSSVSSLTAGDASIVNTATVTIDTTATQTVDLTTAWSAAGQTITNTNFLLYSPNNGPAPGGGGLSVSGFDLTDGTSFWGPTFALTKPVPGNFTNFNFAGTGVTATLTTTNGIFSLREQGSSTTGQIVGTTSAIIAATFTMQAAVGAVSNQTQDNQFGICVTDGTKFIVMAAQWFNGNLFLNVSKYNTATSFNADYQAPQTPMLIGPLLYFQVQETASNRIWSACVVDRACVQILSTTNIDFLTTTRYGIFVRGDAAAADTAMALYSFKESNP